MLFADYKPFVKAFAQRSNQSVPCRVRHMAFISKFTANLKYVKGSANLSADALSWIEINSAIYSKPGIGYRRLAEEQQRDEDICDLLRHSESSSLGFNQYAFPS